MKGYRRKEYHSCTCAFRCTCPSSLKLVRTREVRKSVTHLSVPNSDVNYHSFTQNFTSHQGTDYWHLAIRGHVLKSRNQ